MTPAPLRCRAPGHGVRPARGQSSIETTVALVGAFVLLLGSVKIVLWAAERYHTRLQNYNQTRTSAASVQPRRNLAWNNDYEPTKKLDIFNEGL